MPFNAPAVNPPIAAAFKESLILAPCIKEPKPEPNAPAAKEPTPGKKASITKGNTIGAAFLTTFTTPFTNFLRLLKKNSG